MMFGFGYCLPYIVFENLAPGMRKTWIGIAHKCKPLIQVIDIMISMVYENFIPKIFHIINNKSH